MIYRNAFLVSLACFVTTSAEAISFTPIPDVRTFGGNYSIVKAITDDGTTIFGEAYTDDSPELQTFSWTEEGGMIPFGFRLSNWNDISGDGNYFFGRKGISIPEGGSFSSAVRWSPETGFEYLWDETFGLRFAIAHGASYDGSVAVGYGDDLLNGVTVAMRWREGVGNESLGDLPGLPYESYANAVSGDGEVVAGLGHGLNGIEAFRWTEADQMTGLGFMPGGNWSIANGVSGDGEVIVGYGNGDIECCSVVPTQPFRWTEETGMVPLGRLPESLLDETFPTSVSNDGDVIVGNSNTDSSSNPTPTRRDAAFVWQPVHGMRSIRQLLLANGIDVNDWSLFDSVDVSADGLKVIGNGINIFGFEEAWIVDLTPPPGDGNGDLIVDGEDYLLWAGHYGDDPAQDPPGAPANGDFNGDGIVDGLDYLTWAANFSQSVPATAVPEPSSFFLIFASTLVLLCYRIQYGQ